MRVTVDITALSSEGSGIGPIIEPAGDLVGKKVLVSGTIPGERVEIELHESSASEGLAIGHVEKIITTDNSRRSPPCKYVPECGGCSLQHIQISKQRSEKLAMVRSLLERQAKLSPRAGYTLLGESLPEFNYRNRILLHLSRTGQLGFYKAGTGDVVDIDQCLLAEDEINTLIASLRVLAIQIAPNVAAIKIERRESGFYVLLKPRIRGANLNSELEKLRTITAKVLHDEQDNSDAGHFSQVNSAANEILVNYVIQQFNAQDKSLALTEFYAGAGNFTFPLASSKRKITAVELDAHLTDAASARIRTLNLEKQVCFITQSCEKFCKSHEISELVLLDPPRAGAKIVAQTLDPKISKFIVYVSCNPATLVRDLKILINKGYSLERVVIIDMFSQTSHVETITTLISNS